MEKISNRIIAVITTVVFLFLGIKVTGIGLEKLATDTSTNETTAAILIFSALLIITIFSTLFTINYFKDQAVRSGKLSR